MVALESSQVRVFLSPIASFFTDSKASELLMPDSHFLELPSYEGIFGPLRRNVNLSPPDARIIHWLGSQAPRLARRDEGNKSSILLGLYAFFCGDTLTQVELINSRTTHDEAAVSRMRAQFRPTR